MSACATRALAIGASAGGISALQALLPSLRAARQAATIVVLHLHRQNPVALTDVFASCHPRLQEADDKAAVQPGFVYFAPANYHLLVERNHTFSLNADAPVHWARPSIDVLFQSLAAAYGDQADALLLTGANRDGAEGCLALARCGARVLVQDPEEAEVPSMPRAALELCNTAVPLRLSQISQWLTQQVEQGVY